MVRPGERVLLVYPAGLEFIAAFVGCGYAGVLAVPATYPKPRRPMGRLAAIARDCGASVVLTTSQALATLERSRQVSELGSLRWTATDGLGEVGPGWRPAGAAAKDLAYLQYTSGSTSEPKGVMVSHRNLLANLETIRVGFQVARREEGRDPGTGVFWLPAYHDMGLVGGILMAWHTGGHSVLMSPASFLRRPIRWLEAISEHRATVSGAPNFGYELCVRKTAPAEVAALDLSSWQVAFCGAGTPLGDPIEIQAMRPLFPRKGDSQRPCYVSSVKANIGHTETVSGIAGIIKTALLFTHRRIFPQLHFEALNPNITLDGTRLEIPRQEFPWESDGGLRVAGLSSFGFGGTNSHLILQEAAVAEWRPPADDRPAHVLTLSARSETALAALAGRYARHLEEHPQDTVPDICHTAAVGRAKLPCRAALIAEPREQLARQLAALAGGKPAKGLHQAKRNQAAPPRVAMLFTGQGSQYPGMGRELFESEPLFRQTLQQCQEILADSLDEPLLSVIYPEPDQPSPLEETVYTQPALFAVEYALATVWQSWGIEPCLLLGHEALDAVLEAGPAPHLLGMGRRCLPRKPLAWLPSLRRGRPDWSVLLDSLARLFLLGAKIRWRAFDGSRPHRKITLPTYPFERQRYWSDPEGAQARSSGSAGPTVHPLLGWRVRSALDPDLFENRCGPKNPRYLADHVVQGSVVFPAAAYVEQGLAAACQAFGPGRHAVADVAIQQPLFLSAGSTRTLQVAVAPESAGTRMWEVFSQPDGQDERADRWTQHASGQLRHADSLADGEPLQIDFDQIESRVVMTKSRADFYQLLHSRGLQYGPRFQGLDNLRFTGQEAVADVRLDDTVLREWDQYHLHPALGDACLQALAGVVPLEADGSFSPHTYMPTGIDHVRLLGDLTDRMRVVAVRTSGDEPSPETIRGDVLLTDETGRVLVQWTGVTARRLGPGSLTDRPMNPREWLYRLAWRPQPLAESPPSGSGRFLVFADQAGVAAQLVSRLQQRGCPCVVADASQLDPLSAAGYRQRIEEILASVPAGPVHVVHAFSLDVPELEEGETGDALEQSRRLATASVLLLVQQLARLESSQPPTLWLVTRGAQAVEGTDGPVAPARSPLWGLGRVAAIEHPELRCRLIDLDPAADPAAMAASLLAELDADEDENQIAYRGDSRYVARLERDAASGPDDEASAADGPLAVPHSSPFRLGLTRAGSLDGLAYQPCDRRVPEGDHVEIEVRAAGLNFSDVLKALGLYPGITDPVVPLGIECSGVVTAVGDRVERLRPGDAVFGVAPFSFASHVLSAEYALAPKPDLLSHQEPCTLPITFLTAYYALKRLARIQPGEKVLIHAGAGGVGLAAIQIAQEVGCEIFATAGSDRKRDFLRSLGVKHVMNSRTLDFADQILEITGRRGVDVVLNSLPGEAMTRSLDILAAYGRFLEIGKIDIYQNKRIGLLPFQDNLAYFAIDLDRLLRQRPEEVRQMMAEMVDYFRRGVYRPLPLTRFAADEVVGAFRYMAQRKNIGKVVVDLRDRGAKPQGAEGAAAAPLVRPDGTYLITGGLGALGLEVADWLARKGARYCVLLARRRPADAPAARAAALRARGVDVVTVQGDVADRASLDRALAQIPEHFPPLAGVVHLAGVLDDGPLYDMDLDQLDRPLTPKVRGAWNLHAATAGKPIDFFVLFSSIASVLGSPGQANYAAANAFLDSLAHYRRARGLAATTVNWGPWAGGGMAVAAGRAEQLTRRGVDLLPPEPALQALELLLRQQATQKAVFSVRWPQLLQISGRQIPPLLRDIAAAQAGGEDEAESEEVQAFRQKLYGMGESERAETLQAFFLDQLARIMGLDPEEIDPHQPLATLGLDSLMGIELKNSIENKWKVVLPIAQLMEDPTVASLATFVASAMTPPSPPSPPGP